jgi:hypothetical protein
MSDALSGPEPLCSLDATLPVRRMHVGHDSNRYNPRTIACPSHVDEWAMLRLLLERVQQPQVCGNDPDAAKSHVVGTGPCSTRSNVRARVAHVSLELPVLR